MNIKSTLGLTLLATLAAGGLALAATLPTFGFSAKAGDNMMTMGNTIELSAAPSMKLLSHSEQGQKATLVYASTDAKAAFAFYDAALRSEGWKTDTAMKMPAGAMAAKSGDTMTGKAGDTMAAKPGDAMAAKPGDKMTGKAGDTMAMTAKPGDAMASKDAMSGMVMVNGGLEGYYVQQGLKLDLRSAAKNGRTTVTVQVHE